MSELTTLFKNTADAIRSKTGDTATMKASQFPAKIQGISVGISQDEADARYLRLSGGTMTGNLILNGNPTADNQAATKAYVDSHISPAKTIVGHVSTTYTERTKQPTVNFTIDYTLVDPAKPIIYEVQLINVTLYINRSGNVAVGVGSSTGYKRLLRIDTFDSGTYPLSSTVKASVASQIESASFNATGVLTGYDFFIYPNQLSIIAIDGDDRTYAYVESGTVTLTIYQ